MLKLVRGIRAGRVGGSGPGAGGRLGGSGAGGRLAGSGAGGRLGGSGAGGRLAGSGLSGAARRLLHLSRPGLSAEPAAGLDPTILGFLVCPLSKKRLRYEESSNQLINDELGIAYPVVDGIPNMIPQDARLIRKSEDRPKEEESSQQ